MLAPGPVRDSSAPASTIGPTGVHDATEPVLSELDPRAEQLHQQHDAQQRHDEEQHDHAAQAIGVQVHAQTFAALRLTAVRPVSTAPILRSLGDGCREKVAV